jgi:hypothetical protein
MVRNSAIGAAPSSLKATLRPHVVSIASTKGEIEITGRGATVETMEKGLTTGTTGLGLPTVQGLMIMMTNKVRIDPQLNGANSDQGLARKVGRRLKVQRHSGEQAHRDGSR